MNQKTDEPTGADNSTDRGEEPSSENGHASFGPQPSSNGATVQSLDSLLELENVDLLEVNGRSVILVGTAHVSKESADLAEQVIRSSSPDSVAVELCASRFQSFRDPDRWRNMDIVSVIRQGKAYVLLSQLVLAGFQKKLGDQLEVKPGAEMLRAVQIAEETETEIVLADREVRITLKRTWASLGFLTTVEIITAMVASVFTKEEIDKEEIERLKRSDILEEALKEFSERFPEIRTPLIDERDHYLAAKIQQAPGERVVAIVGAGHVPGIKRLINEPLSVDHLEVIPERSKLLGMVGWVIPVFVIGAIVLAYFQSGAGKSLELFEVWFWINAVMAAAGAALGGAHIVTILVAFVASPFTSLTPVLGVGMVAALCEASMRKPRVSDFENLGEDVTSVRGFYRNRISRVLLIFILSTLFGAAASFIGGFEVIRRF